MCFLGAFRAGLHPKGRFRFEPGRLHLPRGHHPVAALGGGFTGALAGHLAKMVWCVVSRSLHP
jgi:hypothetical protein